MQTLQVGEFFNREDIHSIFSPDSTFTPQAGTWGLQGWSEFLVGRVTGFSL